MQTDTTPNEVVKEFFIAGYLDHDYDRVMELVAEDYVDHSPAGARSNADAVNILRIVKDMWLFPFECVRAVLHHLLCE